MCRTPPLRSTFGHSAVEKVHAAVVRSIFRSEYAKNTQPRSTFGSWEGCVVKTNWFFWFLLFWNFCAHLLSNCAWLVLKLCSAGALIVLGWCSNCARLVLKLCSAGAQIVLGWCSNCAQLVLDLCLAGAQIVLGWCSNCARPVLKLCSAGAQIVLSWWTCAWPVLKLCSAGAQIVLGRCSNCAWLALKLCSAVAQIVLSCVEKVHGVVKMLKTQHVRTILEVELWKQCTLKHILKSCQKHYAFGPLLEVEMRKKCTLLWRKADFEVKMWKTHHVWTTFGSPEIDTQKGR